MVRGNPSSFEIGLSLRKGAYISHASAAYLHELLDSLTVIYINKEQTPKDLSLELTQAGIDAAFRRSPRESNLRFRSLDPSDEMEYVLLNGKSTNRLGVVWLTKPGVGRLPVTNLARTLVDLTVRPQYGGGARTVLKAFKKAREGGIVKSQEIAEVLREVEHSYPYHQAIGFLMDRAGFSKNDTNVFKTSGVEFDFYLEQKIERSLYDAEWRVYYPFDLVRPLRD
jgi:predicted transcriptional regulator of viral defense system